MRKLIFSVLRSIPLAYWNARARFQFFVRGVRWPANLKVVGALGLAGSGSIELGDHLTIVNDARYNRAGVAHPTQLVAGAGASLVIGDNVGISGASICAHESIVIGEHVLIGVNCHIYDTDFHAIDWQDRRCSENVKTAAVLIEDDVWLCANVTVLKGVTIGARSIVAAGSIVTHDIPSDTLAGGIPAKPIRSLLNSD